MIKTKIYFICPNNKFASGGVKQIYRQVELLNKNGFNAVVLHKKAIKESWFSHQIPVEISPYIFKKLKYLYSNKKVDFFKNATLEFLKKKSAKIEKNSILVFPEIYGPKIYEIEKGTRKVIFNQNCYYTFEHYSLFQNTSENPYLHQDTIATICCSEDAENYLGFTFPHARILRMALGIDSKIFSFSENKKKLIAFMPRKLSDDVTQVINILRQRNFLSDWEFASIEDKTEKEVAEIMKQSAIYLSFNYREGFGLPPVEAMATGCYVIGYCGQAGKEYMKKEFSSPVEDGNIISFVEKIEEAIEMYVNDPNDLLLKGKLASNFVLENYNLNNEEKDITRIWSEILNV